MKIPFLARSGLFLLAALFISCKTKTTDPIGPVNHNGPEESLTPDSTVIGILSLMGSDSLQYFLREVTGEQPVFIGGVPDTIESRSIGSEGHAAAVRYLAQKLSSYGLEVHFQVYSTTGTNIYAIQKGVTYPGRQYMITAHYDDRGTHPRLAPGADDNGTGTAAVLEAARLLSTHRTAYSVVYAFWDEEEMGLVGSDYYASRAFANGDSIQGVVNVDMIGWDGDNDGTVEIHSNRYVEISRFANMPFLCNRAYAIGLSPTMYIMQSYNSDHASFWRSGFDALSFIEAYWAGDFNPYYHTSSDSIAHLNLTYYRNCSKLAVATIATLAGVMK